MRYERTCITVLLYYCITYITVLFVLLYYCITCITVLLVLHYYLYYLYYCITCITVLLVLLYYLYYCFTVLLTHSLTYLLTDNLKSRDASASKKKKIFNFIADQDPWPLVDQNHILCHQMVFSAKLDWGEAFLNFPRFYTFPHFLLIFGTFLSAGNWTLMWIWIFKAWNIKLVLGSGFGARY